MRYLFQFMRIILFCCMGEVMHAVLPFPVPASIYGLVLLLLALRTGVVRLEQVQDAGNFLTGIFSVLFVPAAAGVMELWGELGELAVPIAIAVLPITAAVMVSAGHTTQLFVRRGYRQQADDRPDSMECNVEVYDAASGK